MNSMGLFPVQCGEVTRGYTWSNLDESMKKKHELNGQLDDMYQATCGWHVPKPYQLMASELSPFLVLMDSFGVLGWNNTHLWRQ